MILPDATNQSLAQLVSLDGRVAVVTGAAWGLGKATARRLVEAGATVLIADLDIAKAQETASELGANASAIALDASSVAQIESVADHAVSQLGGLDIWVNNAGVVSNAPLFDLADEEWERTIAVNLRGAFAGARAAARRMKDRGKGGVIVNVASLAGVRGIAPGQAAYVGSKHGVVGLTRQMSIELAPHGIRVLAIAPGVCLTEKTEFMAYADPEMLRQTGIPGIAGTAFGRHGVADDVARVVLFCASDLSLFMSGSTLLVDGGVAA
ncbi:MAG: SDR family oxidoreductase [Sphingomonadales bacterium]|nr:SDR family oxidoreductase [Sphingomonadales bacterium]